MLKTKIRKAGEVLGLLFVVLALRAQSYTVTGGKGTPYIWEDAGNRVQVCLVYGMDNVTVSYTSSSSSAHQWYRYTSKALEREAVPSEQNGTTSVIRNIGEGAGYYVDDPASGLNGWFVWIIDYSRYAFHAENISVKGDCNGFWLEGTPVVPALSYYTPSGSKKTVEREFQVAYQTLEWSDNSLSFSLKNVQKTIAKGPYSVQINDSEAAIPLCDTEVTLTGDQFARHFGVEKSITSDTYQAVAVELHADTTLVMDNAPNMTLGDGDALCAPATVTFHAYANEPVASMYTWKIYRSDVENGSDNPLVLYRGEEVDYTFSEKGSYTAEVTANDRTGSCEASASFSVTITESFLEVPNAFSPGTTPGINDEFRVAYKSLLNYKCWIFNRWGVEMYHSTNPAEGWDGKKRGKYVAPGVYFYIIEATGTAGEKFSKKGSINILRPKKIEDEIIEQ